MNAKEIAVLLGFTERTIHRLLRKDSDYIKEDEKRALATVNDNMNKDAKLKILAAKAEVSSYYIKKTRRKNTNLYVPVHVKDLRSINENYLTFTMV